MKFAVLNTDVHTKARCGLLETAHGRIHTPVFMPVGTRGAIKAITQQHALSLGAQIILGNTYHLMLRPGMEVIKKAGGLHAFMQWPNALLTDSGGFQVFSLSALNRVTEEGVHFQSHIDGTRHFLGPEESMQIQKTLGSDIVMAFDQCCSYPAEKQDIEKAMERTLRWAQRCRNFERQPHQSLFGITQGGMFEDLRRQSTKDLAALDFDGYAIGGLSVGEPAEIMNEMIAVSEPHLPKEKPRYVMGVGTPRNIVEAVMRGIDMFDCVLPTRNARNGTIFTWAGKISIKAGRYAEDFSPLDPLLDNEASRLSKAYVRHLLNVDEIAGLTLATLQSLSFYLDFMAKLRQSIQNNMFLRFYEQICALYPS